MPRGGEIDVEIEIAKSKALGVTVLPPGLPRAADAAPPPPRRAKMGIVLPVRPAACNRMHRKLRPHASEDATACIGVCNPMCLRLQLYCA